MAWRHACVAAVAVLPWGQLPGQSLKPSNEIPALESSVARDSNDAQLHYQLAIAYWSRKRFDDAEQSLRAAISIETRFAAAYLALGYLPYARRHQLMEEELRGNVPAQWREPSIEAARLRRRAFLINPLVDLQIVGAIVPLNVASFRREAITLDPFSAFIVKDYRRAYTTFNYWVAAWAASTSEDSIPSGLLWFRGLSAGHVGEFDTAIRDFQILLNRGLEAEHGDSVLPFPLATNDFRYLLAMFKYQAQRFDEAIALYKEALANDAGLFMAHVQMGRIYEERKMWPEAVSHFQDAVATSPDDPSLLLDLGIVDREAGRLEESATTLTEAMAGNHRDSRVPYHLGVTLQQQGKLAEARVAFQRFLALAPSRYGRQIEDVKQRLSALPP